MMAYFVAIRDTQRAVPDATSNRQTHSDSSITDASNGGCYGPSFCNSHRSIEIHAYQEIFDIDRHDSCLGKHFGLDLCGGSYSSTVLRFNCR